jgi:hypothetical protein
MPEPGSSAVTAAPMQRSRCACWVLAALDRSAFDVAKDDD